MKYSTIILTLVAGAFALPQEQSTITSAPASAVTGLTPEQNCAINSCTAGDVTCQASCLGIARPNSSQAVETNECAAKCDQGDGSPEATNKYSECVQSCIASLFPSSQTGGLPAPAAASNAASATGAAASGASQGPSGTNAQATGSSTVTGAAASNTPSGAANANNVQVAGAGLVGLVLAMFAL